MYFNNVNMYLKTMFSCFSSNFYVFSMIFSKFLCFFSLIFQSFYMFFYAFLCNMYTYDVECDLNT